MLRLTMCTNAAQGEHLDYIRLVRQEPQLQLDAIFFFNKEQSCLWLKKMPVRRGLSGILIKNYEKYLQFVAKHSRDFFHAKAQRDKDRNESSRLCNLRAFA